MKYIMVEARLCKRNADDMTVLIPVTFSKVLVHRDMFEAVYHNLARDDDRDFGDIKCVGAGFVDSALGGYRCHGESESLGIASRGDLDSDTMNQMRYAHGFSYAQTVESTLEEFFSPLGFIKQHLKLTGSADQLMEAAMVATKAAYELRQLRTNGFRLGAITKGRSAANGDVLTMPSGLKFDYVGPISTVNYNGLSHLIRLAGTRELVEIPDEFISHMLPEAISVDRCLSLMAECIPFNFADAVKGLDVVVRFGAKYRLAGKPVLNPKNIGVVQLREMKMDRGLQDAMLAGEGYVQAEFYVEEVRNKTPFVVTMQVREFQQRAEQAVVKS